MIALLLAVELTVCAAASLREAFSELAHAFESSDVHVALQFAGSQELRVQIENGAPCDVFASADEKQMALLGIKDARVFAHNEPVLVVPRDNPAGIERFGELPKARRVVLGAHQVPIGAYSDRILERAGLKLGNRIVSRELNVRQVLAKVALGEADAGIVYRTDATDAVKTVAIPPAVNVAAAYPIAVAPGAKQAALARRFIEAVSSEKGRRVLAALGFSP